SAGATTLAQAQGGGGGAGGGGGGGAAGGAAGRGGGASATGSAATPQGTGTAAQGAAMNTQQRVTTPSTSPGQQISVPQTGDAGRQSTLPNPSPPIGPATGGSGPRAQTSQSQLPPDVLSK